MQVPREEMRIATWNINGMRARLTYLQHWLREVQPDVVGIQELKMTDAQFPHAELKELGYFSYPYGQKGWNGVAVLTRREAEVVETGLPGQSEAGARHLTVMAEGIRFSTVYCPNGKTVDHPDFPKKLAFLDALVEHHASVELPAVLCGDFNVVPSALDSWDEPAFQGAIFHTEGERSRLMHLQSNGYVDLFRSKRPDDPGFTWWDYRAGAFHKKQGLRIDLMFGSPSLAERVREVYVERRWRKKIEGLIPSDHTPVWIDLDV